MDLNQYFFFEKADIRRYQKLVETSKDQANMKVHEAIYFQMVLEMLPETTEVGTLLEFSNCLWLQNSTEAWMAMENPRYILVESCRFAICQHERY